MEKREALEREINLSEILWSILLGWRKLICCAIVFGILLGGFRYARDLSGYRASQKTETEEETSLLGEERNEIENIKNLRKQQMQTQEYLSNSAYMQMDPFNVPIVELHYYIKSDYVINYTKDALPDYTDALGAMYYRYIASGEMRHELLKKAELSISLEELAEMVDVGQNANTISLSVKYPQEEKLGDISTVLKELLSQKERDFQKIGSHSLILMGESQSRIVDNSSIEKRSTLFSRMASVNVQINQLKGSLSAQQKNILNEELETGEEQAVSIKPQPSKKFVLLGGVVGIFLAAVWIVCRVLFTAKLQSAEEIRTLYGMRLLGEVSRQDKKKRFFSFVDRKLLLIKNRRRKQLTKEQQINLACTNIAISCKEQGINNIYLTGSEYEHADAAVTEALKKKLKEQGIQVEEGANMYYDASSMMRGKALGNILLIEQIGESVYDEISHELQLIAEQNSNVLGVVVLT